MSGIQESYPKLMPAMREHREALLYQARSLQDAGLAHASNRYYEAADRIRRAIENIAHEDNSET